VSEEVAASWPALGSTAGVVVTCPSSLRAARRAVEAELAALDLACSRFRDDSELSRLNASGGRPCDASPLLLEAVGVALRAAALTEGIVDPTVGEALVLAGYDRDFSELADRPAVPLVARRVPGWTKVRLDLGRRTVRIPPGVRLDLGATAKALGADRAAAAAAREAGDDVGVLVNLGGDIATAGPAPAGGWLVRVTDDHRAPLDEPGQLVGVATGGLATSSTAVRRWGSGAHHIIDPRTGVPAESPWRTVSVAARTCVDANIASTAAIVLGQEAHDWLASRGLPARLVDGGGRVITVADWPAEQVLEAA
jgi:thiamine biosynthesis lipoprotein